ncbi:MAG TPA: hypothetical protein VF230_06275 [Acidimicrobiales bacterium]
MATVNVTPQEFNFVSYDAAVVERIAEKLVRDVGLGDATVDIEIDEKTPLGRQRIESVDDPVKLFVEGGAFEDPTEPRHLTERGTADVLGRLLFRVADRRSGRFDDAPADTDMSLQESVAWDAYCMGRLERLGYDVRKPRRQYHFRTRHGFNDVADAVFERLWSADELTWADVAAACAETEAIRQPA